MKLVLFVITVSMSFGAFANMSQDERIKRLEARIQQLEQAQAQTKNPSSNGLKVKDMKGQNVQTQAGSLRGIAGAGQMPTMTKEQQEEIMKQIELFKKRQQESQKILDELMQEP